PTVVTAKYQTLATATAASAAAEKRPTIAVSTTPISIIPICTAASGRASRIRAWKSALVGRSTAERRSARGGGQLGETPGPEAAGAASPAFHLFPLAVPELDPADLPRHRLRQLGELDPADPLIGGTAGPDEAEEVGGELPARGVSVAQRDERLRHQEPD